jgi:hypothetical protein
LELGQPLRVSLGFVSRRHWIPFSVSDHEPLFGITLGISGAKRVRCMPLSGRNRSFLLNCGLNIVYVLYEGLFRHALEQKPRPHG